MSPWVPVALFCALAGVIGLRLGLASGPVPDEGAMIAEVAAQHVAQVPGARPTDCAGRPGRGDVWLVVTCLTGSAPMRYGVDRRGRIGPL